MREPQTRYKPWRYEQPSFGQFGVVEIIGDRMACHICGRLYRSVGGHSWRGHGLLADEYRELMGLKVGLVGPATAELNRASAVRGDRTARSRALSTASHGRSTDERAAIAKKAVAGLRDWLDTRTPEQYAAFVEQRRVAARRSADAKAKSHYCVAGCGRLIHRSERQTCSRECERVVRQSSRHRAGALGHERAVAQAREARALLATGMSRDDVAAKLGVHRDSVTRWLATYPAVGKADMVATLVAQPLRNGAATHGS